MSGDYMDPPRWWTICADCLRVVEQEHGRLEQPYTGGHALWTRCDRCGEYCGTETERVAYNVARVQPGNWELWIKERCDVVHSAHGRCIRVAAHSPPHIAPNGLLWDAHRQWYDPRDNPCQTPACIRGREHEAPHLSQDGKKWWP